MYRYRPLTRHEWREGIALTRQELEGPGFNFAAVVGPAPPPERVLAIAAEFFAGWPGGYGILVDADTGHPMEAALRSRGWAVAEDEPALILPQIPDPKPLPANLTVRRVVDESGLHDWATVMTRGFSAPPELFAKFMPTVDCASDPDVAILVGYEHDRPVAGAMMARVDQTASIHGVATVPEARRRGFGRAITWAAIQEGTRRGCTTAALRAMGISYDMYRGMGFLHVCNHRTYAAPA